MASIALVGVFGFLLVTGIPVAFALIGASIIALMFMDLGTLAPVFSKMFAGANSWVFLAIPFFILAGNIMEKGGVTQRLINFANALVGSLPGGLSATNIVSSMFFGGVSGSAVADTSAVGSVLIPAMKRQGYSGKYAAALTASASPLGIIIPPSIPMILWAFIAEVSVSDMFMSGIGPGLLVTVALIAVSTYIAIKRGYGTRERFSARRVLQTGKSSILALFSPLIIIGGIITGFTTPTEAAVVAALYSLFLGMFVYRELKIKQMYAVIVDSIKMTAGVMLIIVASTAVSYILTINDVAQNLTNFIVGNATSPFLLMLGLIVLYLILGMFLDVNAIIILTVPILAPIIVAAGLDPIHTSVVLIVTLGIGLLTPPVGLCSYVAAGIAGLKFEDLVKELIPFVLTLTVCVILLAVFPQIVTFIPSLFK